MINKTKINIVKTCLHPENQWEPENDCKNPLNRPVDLETAAACKHCLQSVSLRVWVTQTARCRICQKTIFRNPKHFTPGSIFDAQKIRPEASVI